MAYRDPTLRHEAAPEEIGRTGISRAGALALSLALLLTIALVPAVDLASDRGVRDTFGGLAAAGQSALGRLASAPISANRELLGAMQAFEDDLESRSLLRDRLLPPVQLALSRTLGLGNEQAYLGRDGWLFYRADLDHVTAPPFLDPAVVERRRFEGSRPGDPLEPDPLPALVAFHDELAARGIHLLLVPAPLKPTLAAGRFSRRYDGHTTPRNPSEPTLIERLQRVGIAVFDPVPILEAAGETAAEPPYLVADTHWRPEAMERVAAELAGRIERHGRFAEAALAGYRERVATTEGLGDIAVMLKLPRGRDAFARQSVQIRPVLTWEGGLWQPDRSAEVLLLGDSFTNVFSDPGLGWGAGAGLAERLAFHLQRPVDRLARNAGGSHVTRRLLAQELARDPRRLDRVKLVVYQFAARELSQGDWPVIPLSAPSW
ncbi:MAG: alginate O-acetyltransferase AlgX-related protein [Thermoanaerobaculia bacterium]